MRMRRKLLLSVSGLCIVLALLQITALSAGDTLNIKDTAKAVNVYALNGSGDMAQPFKYTIPESGAAVLIFFRTDCPYSQGLFKGMSSSSWINNEKVSITAVESSGKSKEEVQAFMDTYMSGNTQMVDMYYDPGKRNQWFQYTNLIESSNSVTFAYVVVLTKGPDGNYIQYAQGAVNQAALVSMWLDDVLGEGIPVDPDTVQERKSGSSNMEKLSQEEISMLLAANPVTLPENVFDEMPSCQSPYATGRVNEDVLRAAAGRLNALRRIAGVPDVQLDMELSRNAQYGAVLMGRLGTITHYPENPGDVPEDFFKQAAEAARTSNLSAGRTLFQSVDGLMLDDSGSNLETLGHRRWQINPVMGKVGFGYAEALESRYRTYTVEKAHDNSGAGCTYDFISWPASGNFPVGSFFTKNTPWSITVNPFFYRAPEQSEITVTLTRESDQKSWTFSGAGYPTDASGKYFNVNNDGYGVNNCIIFRPDGIDSYNGRYTVKVDGLKKSDGTSVEYFVYSVDFFTPNAECEHTYTSRVTEPTCTAQGYTTHTCSKCGSSYKDSLTEALGHNYGEWTVTKPATETEEGQRERTCSRCKNKEYETIQWEEEYTITVEETPNGIVKVTPDKRAAEGTEVTVEAIPDEGYVLKSITVTDANGKSVHLTGPAIRAYCPVPGQK